MHPEKYTSEPLVKAKNLLDFHFPLNSRYDPPETILILMNKSVLNKLVKWTRSFQSNRIPANVFLPRRGSKTIGFLGETGVGGAGVVAHLEYLAAWGVQRVILIGKAGSLVENVRFGDIIIPSKSYRDDGVSNHYLPHEDWIIPDLKFNQALLEILNPLTEKGILPIEPPSILESPVWTTPAPFRETKAEVNNHVQNGMVAVEMESASLFTAAQTLKISAAAVLVISDSLANETHRIAPNQDKIDNQLLNIAKLIIPHYKN